MSIVPSIDLGNKSLCCNTLVKRRLAFGVCLALLIVAHEYEHILLATSPIDIHSKKGASLDTISETRVDILSIGSLTRVAHHDAQERTFGSHDDVRHFVRVTELDDSEATCHSNLTESQIQNVSDFCSRPWTSRSEPGILLDIRDVFRPRQNAGWMCAQKRPIDGLHALLQEYRNGASSIPAYVLIIDDDTYVNVDALLDHLRTIYPDTLPLLRTGCIFDFLWHDNFKFPWGGFGSFLSRRSIQRLLQPIDCTNMTDISGNSTDTDPFEYHVCAQLHTNLLGEAIFFKDSMSISDLLYAFATEQAFLKVDTWTPEIGFCFHSDHALAYFFNYYYIGVPDDILVAAVGTKDATHHWPWEYGFQMIVRTDVPDYHGECSAKHDMCSVQNFVCHYLDPHQITMMKVLHHSNYTGNETLSDLSHLNISALEANNE